MSLSPSRPWEYSAFPVSVAATTRLSPGFIRLTLTGASLRHFAPWGLDQRIKLVIPMPDGTHPDFGLTQQPTPHPREWYARWKALPPEGRNALRTYTPSAIRADAAEIDVDVFLHRPHGPASAWAHACRPGDELIVTGPDIRVGHTGYGIHYSPPAPPSRLLLIGDESALPAINNILAATSDIPAEVFLELGDPADDILAVRGDHVGCHVMTRGAPPGAHIERALRDASADVAAAGTYAWIAGEAAAVVRLRTHLVAERGLPKDAVAFLGYWKLGGPLVA
ncbi:siderophore-interacting protein [Microbacterium sp. SORGH_AS_0888]|uniref:siderophore-interacting protein n=1 Tax=Microbacterium sp. SORGH_AS_0888 TaxID=3041791 RepID=UPI0027802548|nr:siderophore-interacting protein [Microbacterium sp. SORGH_AS_0888]MDQ1128139.1 NADPH-dependent ferric siderophore reductase [Microbacterium sp. SORGH_AS_0888]